MGEWFLTRRLGGASCSQVDDSCVSCANEIETLCAKCTRTGRISKKKKKCGKISHKIHTCIIVYGKVVPLSHKTIQ